MSAVPSTFHPISDWRHLVLFPILLYTLYLISETSVTVFFVNNGVI